MSLYDLATVALLVALWFRMSRRFTACDTERLALRHRVSAIESMVIRSGLPEWRRNAKGEVVFVSPAFVALVGTPVGYSASDFSGRSFDELDRLDGKFRDTLRDLDRLLLSGEHYALAHRVPVRPNLRATVIKVINDGEGGTTFYGVIAPETAVNLIVVNT